MATLKTAILINDDEIEHFFLDRLAKKTGKIENLIWFSYATDALDYLETADPSKIDVIFLDINMPRMNGFEFLEAAKIKMPDVISQIDVVMFSTSTATEDRNKASKFDEIKSYVCKPMDEETLETVVELVT
jgi:two-component SAPR family response regulator